MTKYPSLPTLIENLSASWALDGIVDYSEKTCSNVERQLSLKWFKGVPKTKLFFSSNFPKGQAIFFGKLCFKCMLWEDIRDDCQIVLGK